jgi:hypothetical protein
MDQVVEKCLKCGSTLTKPRKLKDFCSYSCRGQHSVKELACVVHQPAYIGSKNTRKTKALRTLKKASVGGIAFERINSITMRIDQPHKKAVGWLMGINWSVKGSPERWIACVGNHRSEPLPLQQAKEAARGLVKAKKGESKDFIGELNQRAANEVDGTHWAKEKRKWPVEIMGGRQRKPSQTVEPGLKQAILERVLIDDVPQFCGTTSDCPLAGGAWLLDEFVLSR